MKILKYRPEFVFFDNKNNNLVKNKFDNYNYFSSGKSCIDYVCKYFKLKNKKIIIPSYICIDVIDVLKYNKCKIIYADVDINDLNISINSIKKILDYDKDIFAIFIASLYGNPCNIKDINNFCINNNLLLINDCCQSYGAKIDGKCLTEFGDTSFFSFSPGKNLSGFAGGYLFIKNSQLKIKHKYTNNNYFILIFIIFIINRILIDKFYTFKLGTVFSYIKKKYFNYDINYLSNLKVPLWVRNYNLKLINRQENKRFCYKNDYILTFPNNKYFNVIKSIRGTNVSFRLVLLFKNVDYKIKFIKFLKSKSIYYSNGYKSFSSQKINDIDIDTLVVNIPIEKNKKLRKFVSDNIFEWLNVN